MVLSCIMIYDAAQIENVVQGRENPTYTPNRNDGGICMSLSMQRIFVSLGGEYLIRLPLAYSIWILILNWLSMFYVHQAKKSLGLGLTPLKPSILRLWSLIKKDMSCTYVGRIFWRTNM